MTLGEAIKKYRDDCGISMDEFSKRSGISKAYISLLEKNAHPQSGKPIAPSVQCIRQAADGMKMDFDTLFHMLDGSVAVSPGRTKVRVVGRVAAGIPFDAIEDFLDIEEISEDMARKGDYIGLRILGDSMEPDIHNGDTVIVRRQEDAESGETVIALINGNDGVCKKLKWYEDGLALISVNPKYEPMYFTNKQITETPVTIFGKVVELRRKF